MHQVLFAIFAVHPLQRNTEWYYKSFLIQWCCWCLPVAIVNYQTEVSLRIEGLFRFLKTSLTHSNQQSPLQTFWGECRWSLDTSRTLWDWRCFQNNTRLVRVPLSPLTHQHRFQKISTTAFAHLLVHLAAPLQASRALFPLQLELSRFLRARCSGWSLLRGVHPASSAWRVCLIQKSW